MCNFFTVSWLKLSLVGLFFCFFSSCLVAHSTAHNRIERITHDLIDNPNNDDARLKRAMTYLEKGKLDKALKDIQLVDASGRLLTRKYSKLAKSYGHYYHAKGDRKKSLAYFQKYLKHNSEDYSVMGIVAEILREDNRLKESITYYQRIIDSGSQISPGYYRAVAEMLVLLPDQGTRAALEFVLKGNQALNNPPQLLRLTVDYYRDLKKWREAIRWHKILGEALQYSPHWLTEMGDIYRESGLLDEAKSQYFLALESLKSRRKTPARKKMKVHIESVLSQLSSTN